MIATLVKPNLNSLQLFALIAVILFAVAGVVAFMEKTVWAVLICSGLVFLSLALMFVP